jgi:hypothetical protein
MRCGRPPWGGDFRHGRKTDSRRPKARTCPVAEIDPRLRVDKGYLYNLAEGRSLYETNAFRTVAAVQVFRPCGALTPFVVRSLAIASSDLPSRSSVLMRVRQP